MTQTMADNSDNLSGHQIGDYTIEEEIALKRISKLYLGRDVANDRPVFIEILRPTVTEDPELAGRFQRRMETVAQLKHAHIAPIHDIGTTATDQAYAVMGYVAGVTLAQKLQQWRQKESGLSSTAALKFVRQMAAALALAHPAGLIHADLRPQNIFVTEEEQPVLIDLGVPIAAVTQTTHDQKEVTNAPPSQPAPILDYTSPEQLEGKALSDRSNIYSLGVILYELLSGQPPMLPISEWDIFERHQRPREVPLEQVRNDLTPPTYRLVRDCLWQQEWSRFETIEQMIAAVDAALTAEQEAAERAANRSERPQWLWYGAIALGVLIILLAIGLLLLRG